MSGLLLCGVSLLILWLAWPFTYLSGNRRDPQRAQAPGARRAGQQRRAGQRLCGGGGAGLGDRRRHHAAAARPRDHFPRRQPVRSARGASCICRTSTSSASATASASRAAGSGPRGNVRLQQVLAQLAALHAREPFDAILITGDITDAGRSAEWAEFLDAIAPYPELTQRMLILPGNHDLNIVDRANPARLDLPTSLNKRLRKLRMLAGIDAVQGTRVHVVDRRNGRLGDTVAAVMEPRLAALRTFADAGQPRLTSAISELWNDIFPMVLPPDRAGRPRHRPVQLQCRHAFLLHQRARPHAGRAGTRPRHRLPAVSAARCGCWRCTITWSSTRRPPRRCPSASARRWSTATGSCGGCKPLAERVVLLHGHRHVDWIGEYAGCRSSRRRHR